jgi:energy-coupling factor transporter ATP-binding protein EcfA2
VGRQPDNYRLWMSSPATATTATGRSGPASGRMKGRVIAVVGPDGAGKSTICAALLEGVLRDTPVLHVRFAKLLPRRINLSGVMAPRPGQEDHTRLRTYPPQYSFPVALAKAAYLYCDHLLGWIVRVRPLRNRGGCVLFERGWWDMAVDPRRYRLARLRGLLWTLGRFLPQPELVIVLEASAEVINERKAQLPIAELERQRQAWRQSLPRKQRRVYIDASLPTAEVVDAVEEALASLRGEASTISAGGSTTSVA